MDPPPLPPLPTASAAAAATNIIPSATSMHLNYYPDSVDSSPRSRTAETHDDPLPPIPGGSKLRLMCSYGGHIMPRPHDKVLCYIGGETRLVVVDRHSSVSVLCSRLSRNLIGGRPFTLKYQLPNEELDSLVTVATDEDLENLIEEYDRIAAESANSAASSRIRFFLFFNKPETAASMGALLADAKSETWFVDALNGSMLLPRGLSDSATMDCLLNLDSDSEAKVESGGAIGGNQAAKNDAPIHDIQHSMLDSPLLENGSSFGSTTSTPTKGNQPQIRVRVDENGSGKMLDNRAGIEEQFAQISFAAGGGSNMHKHGDGYAAAAALPPHPSLASAGASNRILSDDERSDQGVPTGFRRKPPLPLQPVQHKTSGTYNLPSPDSVKSDTSASSFPMYHQEHNHAVSNPSNNVDASIPSSQIQVQDSGYTTMPPSQPDQHEQVQQQFVHTSMHYIPHPGAAPTPMPSYYQVYAPPSQQQLPHRVDQQYPVYVLPVASQPQQYMTMQSNKDAIPPIYPTKAAPVAAKPEMSEGRFRPGLHMVQVPYNQFQQQNMGFTQMHHAPQSGASANYGYELDQMYYTHHQASPPPQQYQTMTQAAAAAAFADASEQIPADNTNQH